MARLARQTVRNPFWMLLAVLACINCFNGDGGAFTVMMLLVAIRMILRFSLEFWSNTEPQRLKAGDHHRHGAPPRAPGGWHRPHRGSGAAPGPLVPGDILKLASGDMIPADVRVISSKDVFVSQASLTGESLPVEKLDACPCDLLAGSSLDLPNICYMGTDVVSGTAIEIVVATGGDTYFGSFAKGVISYWVQANFDKGVNRVNEVEVVHRKWCGHWISRLA